MDESVNSMLSCGVYTTDTVQLSYLLASREDKLARLLVALLVIRL